MTKKFDCVKFQRERRAKVSKLLSGLPAEEMVRHFKSKTHDKRKAKTSAQHSNA